MLVNFICESVKYVTSPGNQHQSTEFSRCLSNSSVNGTFNYTSWLDMIIAQSDAHNFDAALNNNGLQPVGPRSVEAFQRTDVDATDYDLLLVEPRSVQRSHNCVGTSCTSIC